MLSRPARLLVAVSTVGLVLGPAAGAEAATKHTAAKPLVSLAQARKALPDSSEMPGKPQTDITSSSGAFAQIQPCGTSMAKPPTLKQSHSVTRVYLTPNQPDPNAFPTTFSITAVVFHTTAAAKAGLAAVLHAEKHCAKSAGDDTASITRTLSESYAADGWAGWRSIDHISIAPDPTDEVPGIAVRLNMEFLARGNVLLVVNETGNETATNGPAQDKARKQATSVLLKDFAKL